VKVLDRVRLPIAPAAVKVAKIFLLFRVGT